MKTFADVKRRIEEGVVLQVVENTYRPELNGSWRTVTKTQTNGFYWETVGDGRRFWTEYPKASEVRILDADTFALSMHRGSQHYVCLRFDE